MIVAHRQEWTSIFAAQAFEEFTNDLILVKGEEFLDALQVIVCDPGIHRNAANMLRTACRLPSSYQGPAKRTFTNWIMLLRSRVKTSEPLKTSVIRFEKSYGVNAGVR